MKRGARIWVTRTLPGADVTAAHLKALGYQPVVQPLLEVVRIAGAFGHAPAPRSIACIALTSPNAVDAICDHIAEYINVPAYCVGDTTARAAATAGFKEVYSAAGDIHALAELIAAKVPTGLVFAPGAEQPAGNLPALLPGHQVLRLPVYQTIQTGVAIPEAVDAALIHSPRAGQALAESLQSPPLPMAIIAISQAAARPVSGVPGLNVTIADHPDEEAMLRALGNSGLAV